MDGNSPVHELQQEKKSKEKTTRFDVNFLRSQVLYRAAQGSRGTEFTLARPIVPPKISSN